MINLIKSKEFGTIFILCIFVLIVMPLLNDKTITNVEIIGYCGSSFIIAFVGAGLKRFVSRKTKSPFEN